MATNTLMRLPLLVATLCVYIYNDLGHVWELAQKKSNPKQDHRPRFVVNHMTFISTRATQKFCGSPVDTQVAGFDRAKGDYQKKSLTSHIGCCSAFLFVYQSHKRLSIPVNK